MPKVSGYSLGKWILGTWMLTIAVMAQGQYQLNIIPIDKDSVFIRNLGLTTGFTSRQSCTQYVNSLPSSLQAKGYPAASVDSVSFDSTTASIQLFIGEAYKLAYINTRSIEKRALEQSGWNEKNVLNL